MFFLVEEYTCHNNFVGGAAQKVGTLFDFFKLTKQKLEKNRKLLMDKYLKDAICYQAHTEWQ